MNHEKIITVFGSSRPVEGDPEYTEARILGHALAASGFAVCTGGYGGVMAAVSRGAKDAGGPFLGDSLATTRAYLALYSVTGDRKWLHEAETTIQFIARTFGNRAGAGASEQGYILAAQRLAEAQRDEPEG